MLDTKYGRSYLGKLQYVCYAPRPLRVYGTRDSIMKDGHGSARMLTGFCARMFALTSRSTGQRTALDLTFKSCLVTLLVQLVRGLAYCNGYGRNALNLSDAFLPACASKKNLQVMGNRPPLHSFQLAIVLVLWLKLAIFASFFRGSLLQGVRVYWEPR